MDKIKMLFQWENTEMQPTERMSVNENQRKSHKHTHTHRQVALRNISIFVYCSLLAIFNNMEWFLECIQKIFGYYIFHTFTVLSSVWFGLVWCFSFINDFFRTFQLLWFSSSLCRVYARCFFLTLCIYSRAIEFAHVTLKTAISVWQFLITYICMHVHSQSLSFSMRSF